MCETEQPIHYHQRLLAQLSSVLLKLPFKLFHPAMQAKGWQPLLSSMKQQSQQQLFT